MSGQNRFRKIFGVGLTGAAISLIFLFVFVWMDTLISLPIIPDDMDLTKILGIILIILGLGLHFWSFMTLRNWWIDDKLCTIGPFKYFRHPMYAAWVTFICPGLALYLNSWLYLIWIFILHLIWHGLVKKEERIMLDLFGNSYKEYAKKTGRFFPKIVG